MGVYVIAQISITEPDAYKRYQSRFMDVFARFQGKLLAADPQPEVLEGDWSREKVILMQFPDKKSFEEWATSPDYEEIARDRKAGSEGVFLLVKSID